MAQKRLNKAEYKATVIIQSKVRQIKETLQYRKAQINLSNQRSPYCQSGRSTIKVSEVSTKQIETKSDHKQPHAVPEKKNVSPAEPKVATYKAGYKIDDEVSNVFAEGTEQN